MAILLPALAALPRYFADADRVMAIRGGIDPHNARVLVVEGDLTIDRAGLIRTDQLAPEITTRLGKDQILVALVIMGNLIAPDAVLMEPDYDWSPRFWVRGRVQVKSLCLGGSV